MVKRIVLIFVLCLRCNLLISAQDSIPLIGDLNEDKNLKFQESFFKALSDKAIRNYQKAIGHLEICNEILPKNATVFFEFSKNYFFLNQYQLAKEYANKAVDLKPEDPWIQLHLIKILKKERNFKEAIKIQKNLISSSQKRKEELVFLYLQDRDYNNALQLMDQIEKETGLSKNLERLRNSLQVRKSEFIEKNNGDSLETLIARFNQSKSLQNLIKLLEVSEKENQNIFDTYSEMAVNLYPAQPSVYIFRSQALHQKKEFKKALLILNTGIDFVIDDKGLIILFYEEMAKNYKALGDQEMQLQMEQKAKEIRQ